jgi:hypothetical protein
MKAQIGIVCILAMFRERQYTAARPTVIGKVRIDRGVDEPAIMPARKSNIAECRWEIESMKHFRLPQ